HRNRMVSAEALGFIGAGFATVFFGTNYVPVKNYPTGNGLAFSWVLSVGIYCVGFIAMFVSNNYMFDPWGILGGSLWSIGNLCVIPIVNTIGLGLGLLLWCCSSLIAGFFTGKFGWFGLEKQAVPHTALNWIGFSCIVVAIGFFFFIKPTLKPIAKSSSYVHLNEETVEVEERTFFEKIPAPYNTMIGIGLAIFSGLLYGTNMVPMQLWKQAHATASPLEFVFSHFSGIFLFNTAVFVLYSVISRPPQIYPQTILPSFVSGVLWGIAQVGMMVATQNLGYTIGFPIGSAGPMIVSSLWSVFYFKEIQGKKNLILLVVSFLILGAGITMITLSSF
ncbi:hypothetical protein SAMD00019534_082900, partial [Acytostelium subglobosum LB1]|uniref:hypothetical protein n=1 Tax=Acytostelium subglobosum LB1 TaxID=1410327 RepID=UPI000645227B